MAVRYFDREEKLVFLVQSRQREQRDPAEGKHARRSEGTLYRRLVRTERYRASGRFQQ